MRAGAGYVTACVPASHRADLRTAAARGDDAAACPTTTAPTRPRGVDDVHRADRSAAARSCVGPGLGRSDGAVAFARERRARAPTCRWSSTPTASTPTPATSRRSPAAPRRPCITPARGRARAPARPRQRRDQGPAPAPRARGRGPGAGDRRAQGRRHARRTPERRRRGQPRRDAGAGHGRHRRRPERHRRRAAGQGASTRSPPPAPPSACTRWRGAAPPTGSASTASSPPTSSTRSRSPWRTADERSRPGDRRPRRRSAPTSRRSRPPRRAARCARSSRPTPTATAWCRSPAPCSTAGADMLAVAAAQEAAALREAGITRRILVMGALSRDELADRDASRRRRRRLGRGLPAAAPGRRPGCTSSSTPAWAAWARATPTRRRRVAESAAGSAELELAGLMTHFATADEPGDDFFGEQLQRFRTWLATDAARLPAHAANSRRAAARPAATSTWCARASRSTAWTRSGGPRRARPRRRRSTLRSRVAAVKAIAAGESAGLRPALRRRARDDARHDPDRLRRRLPPRADQQRRRADRRPRATRSSARSRWTTSPSTSAPRPTSTSATRSSLIGGRGRRADRRRGAGAAARHDQLRDHLRSDAARPAPRTCA